MKIRKLFAAILCTVLCMAMLPAGAESATEAHFLGDAELTISVPESWYVGEREDGINSELAQAFALDEASFGNVFTDGLYMVACPDLTANQQLQVIVTPEINGVDMRVEMTEENKQDYIDGVYSTEESGIDVISCTIYTNDFTNYGVTYYAYNGFHALQYATHFEGHGYLFQYCDYTGDPIDESVFVLMQEIVDGITYGGSAVPTVEFNVPSIPVPYTETAAQPGMSAYTMTDIGVSISVPEEWYCGLYTEGADSELAQTFGLSQSDYDSMFYSPDMTISFWAVTDLDVSSQFQVIRQTGLGFIDMRDDSLEWDEVMTGFLSSYNVGELIESGRFETPVTNFIRTYAMSYDGSYALVQYSTAFDGNMYFIQYVDYSGQPLDAETLDLLDSIVYNTIFN